MIQRTNQLNLSGKKYKKDLFYRLVDKNKHNSYVVFAKDKFGEYGQIAYFVVEIKNDTLYVVEFAMSCRVAGKYVESALINWLQKYYTDFKIKKIVFKGVNNSKNILLIDTLQGIGMVNISRDEQELILEIEICNAPNNNDIVDVITDL